MLENLPRSLDDYYHGRQKWEIRGSEKICTSACHPQSYDDLDELFQQEIDRYDNNVEAFLDTCSPVRGGRSRIAAIEIPREKGFIGGVDLHVIGGILWKDVTLESRVAVLRNIAVRKAYHRTLVGTAMFGSLLEQFRVQEKTALTIVMAVRREQYQIRAFLLSLGFIESSEEFEECPVEHRGVLMKYEYDLLPKFPRA